MNTYCSACENILREAEHMFQDRSHNVANGHFNRLVKWVANSIRKSCHLCTILLCDRRQALFSKLMEEDSNTETSFTLNSNRGGGESSLTSDTLTVTILSIWGSLLSRSDVIIAFREACRRKDFTDHIHDMNWSSHTAFQVREWLKSCAESHPQCIGSRSKLDDPDKRSLPTRLLDTGPLPLHEMDISTVDLDTLSLEVNPYLRPCDTKSFPKDTKYLTLSHRWSNPPAVTLNNTTAEQFGSSIPLAEMLKPEAATLKQAVHVTRCLGFRYLWIDALCINQDDEQDKQHEISFMGEIYAGCELSLAATGASSGSDGLFHERSPMSIEPFRKRTRFYGENGWILGDVIAYTATFEAHVDLAPLNERGWVFQERLLSPRVLHFAEDQVYWTCSSLLASEIMPYGNPALKSLFGEELRRWHLNRSLSQISIETHQRTWEMLIYNYSMTSLTFPQDKFVAVSAISRKICRGRNIHPRDYLAGLWRPDLPAQLLWAVLYPWETNPESLPYIAPSWSWASIRATKVYLIHLHRRNIVADLIDASMSLKTSDPFGEITGGYVRLRGPMCKLNRRINPLTGLVELDIQGTHYRRDSVKTTWDRVRLPESSNGSSDEDRFRECKNFTPPQFYLFLINIYQSEQDGAGLILQPIDGVKGRYRRLGIFAIHTAELDSVGGVLDFFSTKTLEDNEFLSFEGPDMYVIDII